MKKLITALFCTVLVLGLTACAENLPAIPHDAPETPEIIETPDKPEVPEKEEGLATVSNLSQSYAYFTVFEDLCGLEYSISTYDVSYIALDLSNVKLLDTAPLIELFQNYCDENNYTLLLDIDSLTEDGYIVDNFFEQGYILSFNDSKLTDNTLVTVAAMWRGGLSAVGAEYTVKLKDGAWEITKTGDIWVS